MPFSVDYANKFLNFTLSKSSTLTPPSSVYIGLCSNDPDADSGTFTELSGGGYERVLIVQNGKDVPAVIGSAANRSIKNTSQINWIKATANWTEAKGYGLFSAKTGGAPFYYAKLKTPVTCAKGEIALFDKDALQIQIAEHDTEIT